jgi:N-acetylglutamate synthase
VTEDRDGWLLRATPGFDRWRNNAGLPLGHGPRDVAAVESFAERHGIRKVVQVAPDAAYEALDAELAARGWERRIEVDVLVADASRVAACADGAAVEVRERPDAEWLAAWEAAEGRGDAAAHAEHVFPRFADRAGFALGPGGGAVGLCVAGDGWGAIFSMATRPELRGRRLAPQVLAALAAWAPAERLFLQVDPGNAPAQRLYARSGFTRSHGFHFRLAP